jgi:hypothetical protein
MEQELYWTWPQGLTEPLIRSNETRIYTNLDPAAQETSASLLHRLMRREFYVLTAVNMKINVFWDVTPRSPVKLPTFRRNKNQSQSPDKLILPRFPLFS